MSFGIQVDLRAVVEQVVEAAEPLIRQAGFEFTTFIPQAAVVVDLDTERISQVLGNVLSTREVCGSIGKNFRSRARGRE